MSRDQAIDMDAFPRDSCSGLSDDGTSGATGAEDEPVLVIARWTDVQRAKRQVVKDKEGVAMVQLRAGGYSETEIARLSERDRLAVRRRWHATVDDILERLGGERDQNPAMSHIDLCLRCGQRPRARLRAITRRVKGGWKVIQPERQASVCEDCLSPELHARIMREQAAAA